MISIVAPSYNGNRVGVALFTGIMEEAISHIEQCAKGALPLTIKRQGDRATIQWPEKWTEGEYFSFIEQLVDFGRVRGDYPYMLLLTDLRYRTGWIKTGNYSD